MLIITLKTGEKHTYPEANLSIETVLDRISSLEFWYLETINAFELYRTSEIAHVKIKKEHKEDWMLDIEKKYKVFTDIYLDFNNKNERFTQEDLFNMFKDLVDKMDDEELVEFKEMHDKITRENSKEALYRVSRMVNKFIEEREQGID